MTDRNSKTSFPEDGALCLEPTLPHGACRDKCSAESETGGAILHPGSTCECEEATGNAAANDKDKLAVKVCMTLTVACCLGAVCKLRNLNFS